VVAKVDSPTLIQITQLFDSVTLKLNNGDELTQAADQIAKLGYQFADQNDGLSLFPLDAFIPQSDRYK
jgi:hypothetical protein